MTTEEAKLILQSYRPGGGDDADPFFSEALKLLRSEPELRRWFEGVQNFDVLMRRAMASQSPPAGLREAILARKKAPPRATQANSRHFLKVFLPLAAAVAIFAGILQFERSSEHQGFQGMTVASFTKQALEIKEQGRISLGTKSTDPVQLSRWLAERGAPSNFVLPPGLHGLPALGCQSYSLGGTKVSLICFTLGENRIAHLFVVDRKSLSDAPSDTTPTLHEENGLAFATWTSGGKSYVLTGDNLSKESIRRLI